jgi:uncharacterized protein
MNILSLNGGGTSGFMSAILLAKIEKEYGNKHKVYEMFDLIAGVSTGSIIGALLAKGLSAAEVVEKYKEFIPEIFGHRNWNVFCKPFYNRDTLEGLLAENVNYPMKDCKVKFMAHAVSIGKPKMEVVHFKSWKKEFADTNVKDICMASSAAPIYFQPYSFDGKTYIDGGLASNNPSMNAISEALRLEARLEDIYNVNIVCDENSGYDKPETMITAFDWLTNIPGVSLYACSDSVHYQCHSLIAFNNHFIQPEIDLSLDCTNMKQMEEVADKLWATHGKTLCENIFF